jgi:hypothetical protein
MLALACVAIITATAQILQFDNFPQNLSITIGQPYTLDWSGQNGYVNITLIHVGAGVRHSNTVIPLENITSKSARYRILDGILTISALNTDGQFVWTPDSFLDQGIYKLQISSPDDAPNESNLFSIMEPVATSITAATSTQTNSIPTISPYQSDSSKSSGPSQTVKVGIGLAIPLGMIVVGLAVFLFWKERRRRILAEAALREHMKGQSHYCMPPQPVVQNVRLTNSLVKYELHGDKSHGPRS